MDVAEDGIYVADESAYTIQKYDFEGNLAYNFGSKGEGKAQFKSLSGLAVDKAQQVYIGDAKKSLIDAFLVEALGHKVAIVESDASIVAPLMFAYVLEKTTGYLNTQVVTLLTALGRA